MAKAHAFGVAQSAKIAKYLNAALATGDAALVAKPSAGS
jgi:DNA-binding phage protein